MAEPDSTGKKDTRINKELFKEVIPTNNPSVEYTGWTPKPTESKTDKPKRGRIAGTLARATAVGLVGLTGLAGDGNTVYAEGPTPTPTISSRRQQELDDVKAREAQKTPTAARPVAAETPRPGAPIPTETPIPAPRPPEPAPTVQILPPPGEGAPMSGEPFWDAAKRDLSGQASALGEWVLEDPFPSRAPGTAAAVGVFGWWTVVPVARVIWEHTFGLAPFLPNKSRKEKDKLKKEDTEAQGAIMTAWKDGSLGLGYVSEISTLDATDQKNPEKRAKVLAKVILGRHGDPTNPVYLGIFENLDSKYQFVTLGLNPEPKTTSEKAKAIAKDMAIGVAASSALLTGAAMGGLLLPIGAVTFAGLGIYEMDKHIFNDKIKNTIKSHPKTAISVGALGLAGAAFFVNPALGVGTLALEAAIAAYTKLKKYW